VREPGDERLDIGADALGIPAARERSERRPSVSTAFAATA
jgi:hypothetical protein